MTIKVKNTAYSSTATVCKRSTNREIQKSSTPKIHTTYNFLTRGTGLHIKNTSVDQNLFHTNTQLCLNRMMRYTIFLHPLSAGSMNPNFTSVYIHHQVHSFSLTDLSNLHSKLVPLDNMITLYPLVINAHNVYGSHVTCILIISNNYFHSSWCRFIPTSNIILNVNHYISRDSSRLVNQQWYFHTVGRTAICTRTTAHLLNNKSVVS
jgi:hypothetical protein